jgi:hypothetical protein
LGFSDWFGRGRRIAQAKKAELAGDLARAVQLFVEADALDEAGRVMLLRGDTETDPRNRLLHYTQAARTAPEGHATQAEARRKRAELMLALAGDGGQSAVARKDMLDAARELEEIGEGALAAEAYRKLGDREGEARALAIAGDVERLEYLLSEDAHESQHQRDRQSKAADVEVKVAAGLRREALTIAERLATENKGDQKLGELARGVRERRLVGPVVRALLGSEPVNLVLGEEVIIGRTEGALQVASSSVSREHLRIAKSTTLGATLTDLGSRNGTLFRGAKLAGALPVHEGVEVRLGGEVRVRVTPSSRLPGALDIELGGERYVAPLGTCRLPIAGWRLETAADGWVELHTDEQHPAFVRDLALAIPTTLLRGDELSPTRGGEPVLRFAV